MSFGRVVARPGAEAPCPCGGGAFGTCCGPLLDGAPAPTVERLMRSRYTAYAVRDADHLVRTWHPRTRPAVLELDDETVWDGLAVHDADEADGTGVVDFTASWHVGADHGRLTERSRFVRRAGPWVYVDGDVA